MPSDAASRHVILSGCSGGGKSTLLAELERRGYRSVAEPGRRIVAEESRGDGRALPWVDPAAFARRAVEMARRDRARVNDGQGWVFFDRGLVDAAAALEHAAGICASDTLEGTHRFHRQVFLTPPWPDIFRTDAARRHGMDEAVAEYRRLLVCYESLGYDTIVLPKTDTRSRADFVLRSLC